MSTLLPVLGASDISIGDTLGKTSEGPANAQLRDTSNISLKYPDTLILWRCVYRSGGAEVFDYTRLVPENATHHKRLGDHTPETHRSDCGIC